MTRRINIAELVASATDRHVHGDTFIFSGGDDMPAVWGDHADVLWPDGEALWLAGGVGVGKSTVLQQLILHGIGVRPGPLLGYTVRFPDGVVGYVAADRPSQIRRSWRRMVTEADRGLLAERLDVWQGAFPFDLASADVGALADFVEARGWTVLAIDSLKDVTSGTTDDDDGLAINRQFQELLVRGVELVVNHHDRKGDGKRHGPKSLDDLYGSRWLSAGAGSVLYIAGEPGSEEVELHHLKIPADRVGPLTLRHDHHSGTTSVVGTPQVRKVRSKDEGKQAILAHLEAAGSATRSEIAGVLDVSPELAGRYLRELLDAALVREERVGTASPSRWSLAR
jgi:replicative DNA helicase